MDTSKPAKVPTNPALWELIKKKYRASSRGGDPGRWSAQKAVLSQALYKKRGGRWKEAPAPHVRGKDKRG